MIQPIKPTIPPRPPTLIEMFAELPIGWQKFMQSRIQGIESYLHINGIPKNVFNILQVKEKYGEALLYYHWDFDDTYTMVPDKIFTVVDGMVTNITIDSKYICSQCGGKATVETTGYILPYCDDCVPHPVFQPAPNKKTNIVEQGEKSNADN